MQLYKSLQQNNSIINSVKSIFSDSDRAALSIKKLMNARNNKIQYNATDDQKFQVPFEPQFLKPTIKHNPMSLSNVNTSIIITQSGAQASQSYQTVLGDQFDELTEDLQEIGVRRIDMPEEFILPVCNKTQLQNFDVQNNRIKHQHFD
ncbi:Hypothetical_protein [Hexamita inflata]|uniref:Hypothetical_protein n=1 Tax=Hexamita inflata TaxID=28002 RepID=A0AA86NTR6_9EUKA|nr:Hypothetical protein HINF_LOCUS13570 [Hexamita inflata]